MPISRSKGAERIRTAVHHFYNSESDFTSNSVGEQGFVYVVESEKGIKIGFSANPRERVRLLEREHGELYVWACVPGSVAEERWLQRRWSHINLHGEWFEASPELMRAAADGRLFDRPGGLCKFRRVV